MAHALRALPPTGMSCLRATGRLCARMTVCGRTPGSRHSKGSKQRGGAACMPPRARCLCPSPVAVHACAHLLLCVLKLAPCIPGCCRACVLNFLWFSALGLGLWTVALWVALAPPHTWQSLAVLHAGRGTMTSVGCHLWEITQQATSNHTLLNQIKPRQDTDRTAVPSDAEALAAAAGR